MLKLQEFIYKFLRIKRRCEHKNKKYRQWVKDDTPMIHVVCNDCGEQIDFGYVYGDSKGWESNGWIL